MRAQTFIALIFIVLTTIVHAQEKPQDKFFTPLHFHQKVPVSCDYLLFLPKDYQRATTNGWPLMLFLHGAGERGTNVWRADIHGPARYLAVHPEFPFVMIAPICPSNEVWSTTMLEALLDESIPKYHIDTNRVYLTGLSMGGFGAWELALACPERFAAVIPIAGGGNDLPIVLDQIGYGSKAGVAALKSLPFWVFHGAKDKTVDPGEDARMVTELKRLGVAEVKYTVYPDATHNSWERTYNNPEVYEWLLQHHR